MCSISFLPQPEGLFLAMNRDEQLSRAAALPPRTETCGRQRAIFPREPSGGTWIGVNENGLAAALVNWYARTHGAGRRSRGEIIPLVLGAADLGEADCLMRTISTSAFNPFRLLLFSAHEKRAAMWNCADGVLERIAVSWTRAHWFSSGYDEVSASAVRGHTVLQAAAEADAGSIDWVRRLHRSHTPSQGPFSICMHREDACTVSYTEVRATRDSATCQYFTGSPCQQLTFEFAELTYERNFLA